MQKTSPSQPIFNVPWIVVLVIGVMALIQGVREVLPYQLDADILARFAFVAGRFTFAVDPARVTAGWPSLALGDAGGRETLAVARFFLGDGSLQPWTPLTYALLHGGWMHLGLNAIWLLAFGTPLARRIGPLRFLLFCAVGAVAGAAAFLAVDPAGMLPLVGASASVSACMAASLRFMFQPARQEGDGVTTPPGHQAPRLSLRAVLADRRALAFLLVWFVTNLVTGLAAVPFGLSEGPIAWQAHIGGFLLGLFALPLFERPMPPALPVEPEPGRDVA